MPKKHSQDRAESSGQLPELANITRVTDFLWIGGELHATESTIAQRQLEEVCRTGIDSIIDCRYEREDIELATAAHPQMDYLHLGVRDAGQRMPASWFDDGSDYAIEQIVQGHVVLAHCQAGINRGPSMGFAILLAQGWDVIDALDHIRRERPIARIGYAEDAVDWWYRKVEAPQDVRRDQIDRVRQWRADHDLPRRSDVHEYTEVS